MGTICPRNQHRLPAGAREFLTQGAAGPGAGAWLLKRHVALRVAEHLSHGVDFPCFTEDRAESPKL